MNELENTIDHPFSDKKLLQTALTHSSYANENKGTKIKSNERLEFLGDSVLGMLVAERLYRGFPDMPEGEMTRLRAELVCEQSLHAAAEKLSLGRCLLLGNGEELCGGRTRPSILADAVEALLAAVFLDGGSDEAARFVDRFILADLKTDKKTVVSDYKTALQERAQRVSGNRLTYAIISESGPDHDKVFTAQVLLNGSGIGTGSGRNKKEAEQAAAKVALESKAL